MCNEKRIPLEAYLNKPKRGSNRGWYDRCGKEAVGVLFLCSIIS